MAVTYLDKQRRPVRQKRKAQACVSGGRTLYRMELRFYDAQGSERRRRGWFATLGDAEGEILRLKGAVASDDHLTWVQALTVYLRVKNPSERTREDMRATVARVAKQLGPRPGAIERKDMARWLRDLAERTTGRTANKTLAYLRTVVNVAHRQGELPERPAWADLPNFGHEARERRPFDPAELPRYMDALDERVRLPVLACAITAARVGAVCALEWSDIDRKRRCVRLHTKGRKVQVLPITSPLQDLFNQARALWQAAGKPTSSVFFNRRGTRWESGSLDQAVKRAWRAAGLPRRTVHELRHTVSTLAGGLPQISPRDVQALLNHAHLSTTDLYSHAELDRVRATMDAVWRAAFVPHIGRYFGKTAQEKASGSDPQQDAITCPKCGHKFLLSKEESPQAE